MLCFIAPGFIAVQHSLVGGDEGVTTLVVCGCDTVEDMAVDYNWSAQYKAASEGSLTSFLCCKSS